MNRSIKKELIQKLNEVIIQDIEELGSLLSYNLFIYLKCFFCQIDLFKENKQIFNEYLATILEEIKLLNIIKKGIIDIDLYELDNVMTKLSLLNSQTYTYYFKCLDSLFDALETTQLWRSLRPKKNFNLITEEEEIHNEIKFLFVYFDDIKDYLNLPADYWDYIDDRTYYLDYNYENEKEFIGINLKFENNKLQDFKLFLPFVINLETSIININIFYEAYNLFKNLNKEIPIDYEIPKKEQDNFKTYFLRKN